MPRPFDRLAGNGLRFRMNAFRLRRLPVNGLKTKQCEQGITPMYMCYCVCCKARDPESIVQKSLPLVYSKILIANFVRPMWLDSFNVG